MRDKVPATLLDLVDRLERVRQGILAANASFEHIEREILPDAFVSRQPSKDYRVAAVQWILARLEEDVERIGADLAALLEEAKRRQATEANREREAAA